MNKLYINKTSKKHLDQVSKATSHAYLLTGKKGVGLVGCASYLGAKLISKPITITIKPDESGIIKIKTVRELYSYVRTKQHEKLVVIIDGADKMQEPAQNALLKLLEDPPDHVVFILTAHHTQNILPTISSRVQQISILPVSRRQTEDLLDEVGIKDQSMKQKYYFIAQGLPAEIHRLSEDKKYFEKRSDSMRLAKEMIQGDAYKKLVISYRLGNDREKALSLLQDMAHILDINLKNKPNDRLVAVIESALKTQEKVLNDGNIRVQFLKMCLS